jgi:hypothetical protein
MSAMPQTLKALANKWREIDAVRQHANGWGGAGGAARWWRGLDVQIKTMLLTWSGVDDWARYIDADWAALPDGLKTTVALNARATARVLARCTWR